jgi:ABC-type phosphate transport system substrate-binding protein
LPVGLVAVLLAVVAQPALAGPPPHGTACIASDGKVSGRGSPLGAHAEQDLIQAYGEDFCGSVAEQYEGDPAHHNMLVYNYPEAENGESTGSEEGYRAASCRTDAYAGVSVPYTNEQLAVIDEGGEDCFTTRFVAPYQPQAEEKHYPNALDIKAPIMSFPIGATALAVTANLHSLCSQGEPTTLKLTLREVSRLFGASLYNWNDPELAENNPQLSADKCSGEVLRVVGPALDWSDLEQAFIKGLEDNRARQKCDEGKLWSRYLGKDEEWPGQFPNTEPGCSLQVEAGSVSGVVRELKAVPGAVTFLDLPDVARFPGLVTAEVQNAARTSYQAPNTGRAANCKVAGVVTLPGNGSAAEAVGLFNTEGKNWAVNAEPNDENIAWSGSKYPLCGLVFDLVYSGLHNEQASAIAPLSADQRMTLYAYFSFVLSSPAQTVLSANFYTSLPAAWLQSLREGFQENF